MAHIVPYVAIGMSLETFKEDLLSRSPDATPCTLNPIWGCQGRKQDGLCVASRKLL